MHIYVYCFQNYFPICVITEHWTEFLYTTVGSRWLCFKYSNVNVSALICQCVPLPHLSPLVALHLFSMSVSLFLFRKQVHLCHTLDSAYK